MNTNSAVLGLLIALCSLLPVRAEFRAGVAFRTVNPEPLLPVSGGVGPSNPATQRKGDLTVRALVLEQSGTKVAIVSADFLGFPAPLGDKVRGRVKGVLPENILIAATHTHSAPDCYGFPDGKGGTATDPKYLEVVCNRMAEAINEAVEKVQPAQLRIATGEPKGKIAFNYYAEQLFDPRCTVVQAVGASGQVLATLVNYAVHPEVIGSERGFCSPDLVGPLYDRIQEMAGGVGIFINGAQGGMVTADNRRPNGEEARTWEECQRIGRLLAEEALRIVGGATLQKEPGLSCISKTVSFPVDSPLMRTLMKALPGYTGGNTESVTTRLNLLKLGNAQILTIPGEALPNVGCYLKRKMKGEHNMLFGLTNDAFGYILAKEDYNSFKRYDYISHTSLGERTAEVLEREALEMVEASK